MRRSGVTPALADLLARPERAAELPREAIPPLLCQLSALQSALMVRLLALPARGNAKPEAPSEEDRLLTPEEAGKMLSTTPRWLYRHHRRLPFTRRLSRKALRFSEAGLRRWLAARNP